MGEPRSGGAGPESGRSPQGGREGGAAAPRTASVRPPRPVAPRARPRHRSTPGGAATAVPGLPATAVPGLPATAVPPARPHRLEAFGHVRIDPWHWLRDRTDPDVLAWLKAENERVEEWFGRLRPLEERLYAEIESRARRTDETVPAREGDWFYLTRWPAGEDYPVHLRRRAAAGAPEEVLLDVTELAAGHDFCAVRSPRVSPDGSFLAFAQDVGGRGLCVLRTRDLRTGRFLADGLAPVAGSLEWAGDSRTLFYVRQDPVTLRWDRVFRHEVGADPAGDALVYREEDERFSCYLSKTRSRRFVLLHSHRTVTTEVWILDAERPEAPPALFHPREEGHEYELDHLDGVFYVLTNAGAPNFRLAAAPEERPGRESWRDVVPEREGVLLEKFELFRRHVVVEERTDAIVRLRIVRLADGAERVLEFDEPAYAAGLGENRDPDSPALRFEYTSLTTPESVYDLDLESGARVLRKRERVGDDHDPERYASRRTWATAADGARIPISLVWRKGPRSEEGGPLLLYGYGAYGVSCDPEFSAARLSLLDRGFAFAIAHVRGGQELARRWYEAGRLHRKRNTFTDFVACARHLVDEGWTRPELLFACGESAGGLLVGAVANLAPELFRGMVADVPFVDVLTTMLDPTVPLTTGEYDEWGDPNERDAYEAILSWSPYDNVGARPYPAMLVTASLPDSQVPYWEPAKWVAKLRAVGAGSGPILLRTEMDAGHLGPSARSERWREIARRYAFLLDLAGIRE